MAHTVFPSRMLYVVAVDFQFYKRIHELPPFYPQNLPISLTKSQNSPQPWWMTTFKSCHVLFKCFFSLCESGWCERRGDDWGWAGQPGPIYRWHRWLQVWERGGRGVFPPPLPWIFMISSDLGQQVAGSTHPPRDHQVNELFKKTH